MSRESNHKCARRLRSRTGWKLIYLEGLQIPPFVCHAARSADLELACLSGFCELCTQARTTEKAPRGGQNNRNSFQCCSISVGHGWFGHEVGPGPHRKFRQNATAGCRIVEKCFFFFPFRKTELAAKFNTTCGLICLLLTADC